MFSISNTKHSTLASIVNRVKGFPLAAKVATLLVVAFVLWRSFSTTWTGYTAPTWNPFPPTVVLNTKNVAAIIETRPLSNLVPLILHFATVLGPNWPILVFTGDNSMLNTSIPFQRAIHEGRVQIRSLPPNTAFENHAAVSDLLTRPWFWEQLAPAGHVLLFQADSIVCANSDTPVEDFLSYDFVGAYIDVPATGDAGHGEGYNGGLSLRNRSMILDIVEKNSWKKEIDEGKISLEGCVTKRPCLKFEDQWFYHKMKEMGARLPSKEVASKFAVETVWYDRPLGYHQVERWNANKMESVAAWCPEYKIATTELLIKHGKDSKSG